jgi:hypothetical protein
MLRRDQAAARGTSTYARAGTAERAARSARKSARFKLARPGSYPMMLDKMIDRLPQMA